MKQMTNKEYEEYEEYKNAVLHRSILECTNKGVQNDADMIQYNIPDLFVD